MTSVEITPDRGRHAVVAIIIEESRFLVIRRSEFVKAPGLLCFPGGGIEAGEDFETAVRREAFEELGLNVDVVKHLWSSKTLWGTKLEWLVCTRAIHQEPSPNPEEVSEVHWMEESELRSRADLLGSLPDFFAAKDRCVFVLD
jgi:8-oxo-dGTP pyrophosphatase MutT (NUDIX family)